jgi:hypothetical protein
MTHNLFFSIDILPILILLKILNYIIYLIQILRTWSYKEYSYSLERKKINIYLAMELCIICTST